MQGIITEKKMGRKKYLGKSILLILLIVILVFFGLLWFDYIGFISAKKSFGWFYNLIGLTPQETVSASDPDNINFFDLEKDRYDFQFDALNLRSEELDKREADVLTLENQNAQVAMELADEKKAFEEEKKTFNNRVQKYDDKSKRIDDAVAQFNGMQPDKAVAIMVQMSKDGKDQELIDILRRADEVALETGKASLVSYWISLMPKETSAEIVRKMVAKPTSLD